MQQILDAITSGHATTEDLTALDVPDTYRAATVHRDEVDLFAGMESREKDPRKSLHLDDVPLPELGPGEAQVPTRWRVENSWGTEKADKGFWTMDDSWFDEYVFEIAVPRSALPDDLREALAQEPIVLPAWDPMGALATH